MSKVREFQRRIVEVLSCPVCKDMFALVEEQDARIVELEAQLDRAHADLAAVAGAEAYDASEGGME